MGLAIEHALTHSQIRVTGKGDSPSEITRTRVPPWMDASCRRTVTETDNVLATTLSLHPAYSTTGRDLESRWDSHSRTRDASRDWRT